MEQTILDAEPGTAVAPLTTVAEYNPIAAGIALMLEKHGSVLTNPPVVTDNATAMALAKTNRQELIKFRTTLEKKRVEVKADALAFGKRVDSEAKRLQAIADPIEAAYDKAITDEEQRLAAIAEKKLEAERQRIAGHQARIQTIKDVRETANMCRTAERIKQLIDNMPDLLELPFEEFQGDAETAFNEVCTVLQQLHGVKVEAEAQAAELQRQRDEIAAQQAESNRLAAIQAELIEKQAAEIRDREQAAARQQAELDEQKRQQDQREADHARTEEQARLAREAERFKAEAAFRPAPLTAQDIAGGVVDAEIKPFEPLILSGDRVFVPLKRAEESALSLRLGQINERLAPIQLTADGLRGLGFAPAGRERSAVLYHEQDFQAICRALVEHITSVCELQAA